MPFYYSLKLRIFWTISTILFEFSFSGISFLKVACLISINLSLTFFAYWSFLDCVALIKSCATNDEFWYLKYFQNILSFVSFSLARFFPQVIFAFWLRCLVLVHSLVGFSIDSRTGILSNFFIGNNLLLKLLRTFSLALNNNPDWFN